MVLISKSRGNSNRCTPYMRKSDQHNTYASHTSPTTPGICFLRVVPVHSNLSWVVDRVGHSHFSREKRAPDTIYSTPTDRSASPYPVSLPIQLVNQWRKLNICQQQATRLTEPISPTCDRYVQYLHTGANTSVLNRHRRGLQPWRCQLSTYHSPTFLSDGLYFPPKGLARSQV
jgi:hypothetical protein